MKVKNTELIGITMSKELMILHDKKTYLVGSFFDDGMFTAISYITDENGDKYNAESKIWESIDNFLKNDFYGH